VSAREAPPAEAHVEQILGHAAQRGERMGLRYAGAVTPQEAHLHSVLATLYAVRNKEQALSQIRTALGLNSSDPDVLSDAAITFDTLGDRKQAIQYARKSMEHGDSLADLRADVRLQDLLADPSFRPNGK